MNYWLYSIDWRTTEVKVIGGFSAEYHAELTRDRVIERATAEQLAEFDRYITFGICRVNESMAAAFVGGLNNRKLCKDVIENGPSSN